MENPLCAEHHSEIEAVAPHVAEALHTCKVPNLSLAQVLSLLLNALRVP